MKNKDSMTALKLGRQTGTVSFVVGKILLWVFLGMMAGLGNMMLEISPFAPALCAAVPKEVLLPCTVGSMIGSFILTNLLKIKSSRYFSLRYFAAILIASALKELWFQKEKQAPTPQMEFCRPAVAPIVAFLAMTSASLVSLFAVSMEMYSVIMAITEALLSAACAYFLQKTIQILQTRQNVLTLKRSDVVSLIISAVAVIVSLTNITAGGVSFGRLTASFLVLFCACIGGESWGAISGILCGASVCLAMFPKVQLLGIYAVAGLVAGLFSSLGKFGSAGSFAMTFGALSVMTVSGPILPILCENFITTVGLMLIPEKILETVHTRVFCRTTENNSTSVRQLLFERLEDASDALTEISRTTQAVSQKLDKAKAGSLEQVYDEAIDNVCLRCGLKTRCWQQEYGDTMEVFNHLTAILRKNGNICEEDFGYPLSARCNRRDTLCRYINQGYQELTAKEGMSRKVARVRSVVTDQFEGLAQLLQGLSEELYSISGYEQQTAQRVNDYLTEKRYRIERVSCYRDEEGRSFLQMDCEKYRAARLDLKQMAKELSGVCDCEFDLPQKTELQSQNKDTAMTRLVFREKAEFQAEYACTQHICQGYRICGDACQGFTDRHFVQHIVLSDGMGSGTAAAVDSNMTVSLITKLIDAGVSYTAALKIVNSALLVKSGEESLSTIDIAAINLYTGYAKFYKAGAAPSFVKRGGRVITVESTSLPAGILTSVEFEEKGLRLADGDLLVMVSDGATACGEEWLKNVIEHFAEDGNLQALCDDIVTTAKLRRSDDHDDDITAAACRIRKSEIDMI